MANLKSAIEGETYEFTTMYPDMIKQAQAEGQSAVAKYFDFCQSGGRNPRQALPKGSGKIPAALPATDYYVCKVCGYTHEGPCDACPVCGGGAAAFFKVED